MTTDGNLTDLEKRALEVALAGDLPWEIALRKQISSLKVIERKYTGAGIYTNFSCEMCEPAVGIPYGNVEASPVAWAKHPDVFGGAEGGVVFSIYPKDGMIDCLESATCGTEWPTDESKIEFVLKPKSS